MRTLTLVLCALALSALAAAQSNYAAVSGTVKDSQSLPVVHATVNFKALSTGAIRLVTTNEKGLFYAAALSPDDYEVTTTAGFAPVTQAFILRSGKSSRLRSTSKSAPLRKVSRSLPRRRFFAPPTPASAR